MINLSTQALGHLGRSTSLYSIQLPHKFVDAVKAVAYAATPSGLQPVALPMAERVWLGTALQLTASGSPGCDGHHRCQDQLEGCHTYHTFSLGR